MPGMQHMDMGAATDDMPQMDMTKSEDSESHMHGMYGQFSMTREASGTAWQPEATPMDGLHIMNHGWMFMVHGFADAVYDYQEGIAAIKSFSARTCSWAWRSIGWGRERLAFAAC